ncbi:MAG: tol-pal system protein YbgF [Steroidobacteraceae bacterium]
MRISTAGWWSKGGAVAATGGSVGDGAAPSQAAAAAQAYGRAFDALKEAQYPAAIAGFAGFLRDHPQHELADNAQYWLGQAHYVTRLSECHHGIQSRGRAAAPDSAKASDALLKVGYAQLELRQTADARRTLEAVRVRFPGTDSARAATERLQRLPSSP